MARLSSFFGQAIGSGVQSDVITDPRKLPFFHNINPVYWKWGDGHQWYGSHEDNFWYYWYANNGSNNVFDNTTSTLVDNNGTPQDSSTFSRLGADLAHYDSTTYTGGWVTVMNHTNESGRLCYVKGFGAYGQSSTTADPITSQVRITVDGAAYTFRTHLRSHNEVNSATIGHQNPIWGHFGHGPSPNNYSGGHFGAYYYSKTGDRDWINYDQRDSFNVYDVQARSTIWIPHPSYYISDWIPTLKYENSIKVECAIDKYADTTGGTGSSTRTTHYYTHKAFAMRIPDANVLV